MGSMGLRSAARLLISAVAVCAAVLPARSQTPQAFPWRTLLAHGQTADVESFAAANPTHPDVPVALAALQRARGDDEGALVRLKSSAAAGHVDASLELGLLLFDLGKADEGRTALNAVGGALGPNDTGQAYARVGRAVAAAGDPRQANALYRAAATRAPDDPLVYTWWGDLFLSRHEPAEAARAYRDAIERDPRWAPAHLGLARALEDTDPEAAIGALATALEIDPALVDAHVMSVDQGLDADRRGQADASLAKALAAGPARYDVLARKAVMALLDDRAAEFDAAVAALVARRPSSGEVFRVAAAAAARQYQFDEAVALGRKAVAANESDVRAWAELGLHLARAGDETAAYEALSRAFRADPYDPITYNLLNMLETLGSFASVTHDV